MNAKKEDWVLIGSVAKPFGVMGAVKIHLSNPQSQTLKEGLKLQVENARGQSVVITLGKVRPGGRVDVVEWNSMDQAQLWSGSKAFVRREDLPPISEDEVYLMDLLNAKVLEKDGNALGKIKGFSENKAQHLAIIEVKKGKEVLVPFLPPIVLEIDLET